jgi:hypothetical protein
MSCPNSDPSFDKMLFNSGLIDPNASDIPYQRRRMYYTICILFRLFLAGLVYQLKDKSYIPFIVGIFSILAILNLYPKLDNTRQWWSVKYQFAISVILLVSSVLVYYKLIRSDIIPLALYASVIGGILISLTVKSC